MTRLNAVAKGKLDKLSQSEESVNGDVVASPSSPTVPSTATGVNKDLPLNPDEQAGLREHKRQLTKVLTGIKKAEIEPNHAYPNAESATTLILSDPLTRLN